MTIANREIQRRSGRASWLGFVAERIAAYQDRRRTANALNGRNARLLKDVGMTPNDVSEFQNSSIEQGKEVLMNRAKERSENW